MEDESSLGSKSPENGAGSDKEKEVEAAGTQERKPRVPSALTVENLKKHEEETDAIDVVELMTKNGETDEVGTSENEVGESHLEAYSSNMDQNKVLLPIENNLNLDSQLKENELETAVHEKPTEELKEIPVLAGDIWSQPKKSVVDPIVSPAVREEVRGVRYTGEQFVAISIDVQTDESFLAEIFEYEWPQTNLNSDLGAIHTRSRLAMAETAESEDKKQTKHITSDIATADIADEESVLQMAQFRDSDAIKSADQIVSGESEIEDDKIVNEVTESDSSEAPSHTTHGTTQTLPGVGMPFILQYKPESQIFQMDYNDIDASASENIDWEDMNSEQQEYYKTIMDDMRRLRMERKMTLAPEDELISIEPHSAYGSQQERKLAKERERERSRMREMKKQSRQAAGAGQMMSNQTNFYAFARQLKTVNYALSSEKCMEEGWTIRPKTPLPADDFSSDLFFDPAKDILTGKQYQQRMFVKKFYPNGSIFFTVFPDGTGNVWYPSGNVAFSIVASDKAGKLTFIVHEDVEPSECRNIHAIFEPSGHCTCYYPSGVIRLLLTHLGGEYFSPQGERLKKWIWKDTQTHVHAPPFQPITFALNKRVGIRVLSQEGVYITFSDKSRSVRFNAGTRLRIKPSAFLPKLQPIDADLVMLDEKRARVQSIIERINMSLKFPHSPRLKKLKLPNYLNARLDRTAKLREQLDKQQIAADRPVGKQKKKKATKSNGSFDATPRLDEGGKMSKMRLARLRRYSKQKDCKQREEFLPAVIVN